MKGPAVFQLHQLPSILVMVNDHLQELNDMRNWNVRDPITSKCVAVSGISVSESLAPNSDAVLLLGVHFFVLDVFRSSGLYLGT